MKTVTIPGIGTATYTLREWRHIKRLIAGARNKFKRDEAIGVARLIHEAKVAFGDDGFEILELGPEDDVPLPEETPEQLTMEAA